MNTLAWIVFTPFIILGILDVYMAYRFVRKPEVDKTAGLTIWLCLKWSFASQTKLMVEKLPFISQDLTEMIGVKKDDGKIT